MEPVSAHGLPRLSWIDTLYSSTYLCLLILHHLSHSSCISTPPLVMPVCSVLTWTRCEHLAFFQDFHLSIIVAVYNNSCLLLQAFLSSSSFFVGTEAGVSPDIYNGVSHAKKLNLELCVPSIKDTNCLMLNF